LTLSETHPKLRCMLEVEFADPDLELLEKEPSQDSKYEKWVGKRFRYTMQIIRTVDRKNQLYAFKGLRLKKLERPGEDEAMWLNEKWRLEMVFSGKQPDEKVRILRISNHYGDK
jgi:plasmid maintenance system killer protein